MGWMQIPDFNSSASSDDDNLFAGSKQQPTSKISRFLCKKIEQLNITLVEGYSSRSSEAGDLQHDKFIKMPRSQGNWYSLHSDKDQSSSAFSFWYNVSAKLNSCYSQIAVQACHPLHWHQGPSLKRLYESGGRRLKNPVSSLIKPRVSTNSLSTGEQADPTEDHPGQQASKGKSSARSQTATDELQYLMNFNQSTSVATFAELCFCAHGKPYSGLEGMFMWLISDPTLSQTLLLLSELNLFT